MRLIFVGRDNTFNRNLARMLSDDHEIVFCMFVEPNRFSVSGRLKKIKSRAARYGLFKVMDELAFHMFDKLFLRKKEKKLWNKATQFNMQDNLPFPAYEVKNIHGDKYLALIAEAKPDIVFCVCCSVIFQPRLYTIPRFGTFILHEGITPEYKGLHTTIWALMNNDAANIGYTLLKANNTIDGGDILLQKRYELRAGEDYKTWSWVGHNALMTGMSDIKQALKKLEEDRGFIPLNTSGREERYYSWIGLTEFISLFLKNHLKFSKKENRSAPYLSGGLKND